MNIKKITRNGVAVLLLSLSCTYLSAQNFVGPVISYFGAIGDARSISISHNSSDDGFLDVSNSAGVGDLFIRFNGSTRARIRGNGVFYAYNVIRSYDGPTATNRFIDLRQDGTLGTINTDGTGTGNDATALRFRVNNSTKMQILNNGNVGIGTTTPLARLDVRGDNIFLSALGNPATQFVGLGESGGNCNIYGFRSQLDTENSVNLGMQPDKTPTLLWGNTAASLELKTGTGQDDCGALSARFNINNGLEVAGDNVFLAPSLAGNPNAGKFVGLGESGGGPDAVACDLYGFRSQLDPINSLNVGMKSNKVPTVTWGNDSANLEFRFGSNDDCGNLNVVMGPKATALGLGMFVNDILGVKKRIGIGTDEPQVELDVRGSNIFLSPAGSPFGKFVALGESGGNCDLYGYRAQLDLENSVNLGVQPDKTPTLLWGNPGTSLELRTGTAQDNCGALSASFDINDGLSVAGENIFLAPTLGGIAASSQFVALGESGGGPGTTPCDLYGFRAQSSAENSINVGLNDLKLPTINWGNTDFNLDIRFGSGSASCGTLVTSFGKSLVNGGQGAAINGGLFVRSRLGVGTNEPIAPVDVRGDNIFLSPNFGSNPTAGKFVALGESGGVCDLYGYRAQLDTENSINVGVQPDKTPTIQWGNSSTGLEFRTGTGQDNCGTLVAIFGTSNVDGGPGISINGGLELNLAPMLSLSPGGNIAEPIEGALDKVLALDGLNYQYTTPSDLERNTESTTFVLDPEAVMKVMPELVDEKEDRTMAVNYTGMIPVIVEAFQEQQDVIKAQSETIEQQREELVEMETRLARLEALMLNGQVSSNNTAPAATISTVAEGVKLNPNRPNPFNNITAIDYTLPENMANANLVVFDITGEKLASYELSPGTGTVEFSAVGIGNGTYVYVIFANGQIVAQQKMTVQK